MGHSCRKHLVIYFGVKSRKQETEECLIIRMTWIATIAPGHLYWDFFSSPVHQCFVCVWSTQFKWCVSEADGPLHSHARVRLYSAILRLRGGLRYDWLVSKHNAVWTNGTRLLVPGLCYRLLRKASLGFQCAGRCLRIGASEVDKQREGSRHIINRPLSI
jgi:hypothetical protein